MILAAGDRDALARLIAPAFALDDTSPVSRWQWFGAFLDEALARGLDLRSLGQAADRDALAAQLSQSDQLFAEATGRMNAPTAALPERLAAASLLARHAPTREAALASLSSLLQSGPQGEFWSDILSAFSSTGADTLPDLLLNQWPGLSPRQRGLALDTLLRRPAWSEQLLASLESGTLRSAELDPTRRRQLLHHPDKTIQGRAARIFNLAASPGRAEVIARYQAALSATGDAPKGGLVYQRACAACHQHGGEGLAVGPRLETVADHPVEKILTKILDQNLDIQPGFHAYNVTLKAGGQLFGLLAGESAAGLTIKTLDGKTHAVRRDEVAGLQSTQVSLMPEGLEAMITVQEMGDVLAFLRRKNP